MIDAVTIPENCPTCDRRLVASPFLAPYPQWQWSARVLLLSGIVVSGILAVLALIFAAEIVVVLTQGQQLGRKERHEWGMVAFVIWAIGLVVALLPGLGMAALAARLPRVLPLRCRGCGWSESFVLPRRPHEAARPVEPADPDFRMLEG